MQIIHAGFKPVFEDVTWSGMYQLRPFDIWDGAVRWTKGMYKGGFHIVSFQLKKRIPIGRGGMILTDDPAAAEWFRKMTYDGRDLNIGYMEDDFEYCGYHYYMTPEIAQLGIDKFQEAIRTEPRKWVLEDWPDLTKMEVFK